jgi:hypothetical protein
MDELDFFLNDHVMRKTRRPWLLEVNASRNTGKKVSAASLFLRLVIFVSPLSAFRQQAQSGTAGHRLVQHCQGMVQ